MAENESPLATDPAAVNAALPKISVPRSPNVIDYATILGLIFACALIAFAIILGDSKANFFNIPSVCIVIFGTIAVTSVSYTGEEIIRAGNIISKSMMRRVYKPHDLAKSLVDLAVTAKKKGVLALASFDEELGKIEFMQRAIQMAVDGGKPADIDYILSQEIGSLVERHRRTASITKRASEVAPAMGLIGTLVGLVQMLADLENPETIGPAMAVALLTTFYGAILGTVVMAPLAVKLEKNSLDEALVKNLIRLTAISIAKQDNPRKLEMELNSALPPLEQIRYFD